MGCAASVDPSETRTTGCNASDLTLLGQPPVIETSEWQLKAQEKFAEHDVEGKGKLDKEAFVKFLPVLGIQLNKAEAEALFAEIDTVCGGTIHLEELLSWYIGAACVPVTCSKEPLLPSRAEESPSLKWAQEKFAEHDVEGIGELAKEEFVRFVLNLGMQINQDEAEKLFDEIDTDCGGTIDLDEFSAWYSGSVCAPVASSKEPLLPSLTHESLVLKEAQRRFGEHDVHGSGELDKEAFVKFLPKIAMQMDDDEAEKLFAAIDTDCGGSIDWDEFSAWYLGELRATIASSKGPLLVQVLPNLTHESAILKEAQQKFTEHDVHGYGELNKETFVSLLPKLGMQIDKHEAEKLFSDIDTDCGGSIDYDEFSVWYSESIRFISKEPVSPVLTEESAIWKEAEEMFAEHDAGGTGELDKEAFVTFLPKLGVEIDECEAEKLFAGIDKDCGGTIDLDEFTSWYSRFLDAKKWFCAADADGNGDLDMEEFTALILEIGIGDRIEAEKLFTEIDTDKGGSIDVNEFLLWYSTSLLQPVAN